MHKGYPDSILFDIGDKVRTTWQDSVYGETYEGEIVGIGYSTEQWLIQQDDGTTEMIHESFMERISE